MINGKKYYFYVKDGYKYIYNEKHQLVDAKGNLIPKPPKSGKTSKKSSEWKDVKYFLEKGK